MADVEFEDEKNLPQVRLDTSSEGKLYTLLISWGLAKDEKGAGFILLGFAIVLIVIAVAAPFFFGASVKHSHPTPTQIQDAFTRTG